KEEAKEVDKLLMEVQNKEVAALAQTLRSTSTDFSRKDVVSAVRKAIRILRFEESAAKQALANWYKKHQELNYDRYNSKLYTEGKDSPSNISIRPAEYTDDVRLVDGREILNACFDANFSRDPRLIAFGEDVGRIGDVNQGFAGLQAKYGAMRIADTGIREMTIAGQGIGLAMRGLKPIAEIQYLDYLLYTINILSDDLACLSYRTKAGQKAPVIIRTRGHRLEGIWHSGSPMGMIISSLRGMHVCVPRNMTQAAGMYNTLFRSDEPAILIECLNGYR
ncbi:MAG TPA: transketolase, partial [Sphingobacteriaceae bacterium]|nr:transketolase [Sphingobacteriaceae bacterium]